MSELPTQSRRRPTLGLALLPIFFLVATLWLAVVHYREFGLSAHIPLVLATVVASLVALRLGNTWVEIEKGMVHGISLAIQAMLILLVVGVLIATWVQAGIVPAMISYGLEILSPRVFLPAACLICVLVALASGSSWSTAATVGIALVGVGEGLGIPRPMIAGAILSGAYFGDKMSPLSDTTNLAPAVAGATLFEHVRHMVYTTVPSLLISLIVFTVLGWSYGGRVDTAQLQALHETISTTYVIHPLLLAAPLLVIVAVILRIPALPALLGGALLGGVVAAAVQGASFPQVLAAAFDGISLQSGNAFVDSLLSRGGMSSMLPTVALIVCALSFGGVMERCGLLEVIAAAILRLARGTGGLISATLTTCVGMNCVASDQYLAVVIPGRMFREAYARRGLAAKNLSRALEDSGTLTSVLLPWNSCGAFMIATLGLAPWTYVPYCIVNWLTPLISALYGITGFTIERLPTEKSGGAPHGIDDDPPKGCSVRAA